MSVFYGTTETAVIVRKELKSKFPGVRFSVVSRLYAGGSSIDVKWLDGPTQEDVNELCIRFQGSTFDGSTDSRNYHSSMYNGQEANFAPNYVTPYRGYTEGFITFAVKMFCWENSVDISDIEIRKNSTLFGTETFYADYRRYRGDNMDVRMSKFIAAMPGFTGKYIDYMNEEYKYKKASRERAQEEKDAYSHYKEEREEEKVKSEKELQEEKERQEKEERDNALNTDNTSEETKQKRDWTNGQRAKYDVYYRNLQETQRKYNDTLCVKRDNFRMMQEDALRAFMKSQEYEKNDFDKQWKEDMQTGSDSFKTNIDNFAYEQAKETLAYYEVWLQAKIIRIRNEKNAQNNAAQENLRKAREQAEKLRQQEEKERQAQADAERRARQEERIRKAREDAINAERVKEEIKVRDAEERGKRMVLHDKFAAREYLGLGMFPSNAEIIRAFRDLMKTRSDGRGGYVAGVDIDFLVKVKEMALEPITAKK